MNTPSAITASNLTEARNEFFGALGLSQDLLLRAIDLALAEDLGYPAVDLTTQPLVSAEHKAKAIIYCLSRNAVIAGISVIEQVFHKLDPDIKVSPLLLEGQKVTEVPHSIAHISGNARAILSGERVALNLLQRMCAVATTTDRFVQIAKKFNIAILDTRKTTPALRVFEKYAVLVGGGQNHRFGLNDAILVKDNHIQIAGGITKAVSLLRAKYPGKSLETECTTLSEVQECLNLGVDRILLDNMSPALVQKAVDLIKGKCFVEVSGGINLENITGYLQPGVNAISVGALTHSAVHVDLSLEMENQL